ncbi:MAG: hypothetical protein ACKVOM_06100 [Ferruginibacter sp.]
MHDTTFSNSELLLNIKAAFSVRKIKTISRKDTESFIYNEVYAVTENYVKSGGDLADINKKRNYQSANIQSVANSLTLDIRIDKDGFINDTIRWDNHTVPINMLNFPKTKWHYMILDSTNAKNMLHMSQSIVDSIIASNVLVKE